MSSNTVIMNKNVANPTHHPHVTSMISRSGRFSAVGKVILVLFLLVMADRSRAAHAALRV